MIECWVDGESVGISVVVVFWYGGMRVCSEVGGWQNKAGGKCQRRDHGGDR